MSEREMALYEQHFALLRSWNENMSLVSPKSIETAFATHYVDSLHMVDFVLGKEAGPTQDLGTGAGFPGIVYSIRRPEQPITLYEKSQKKLSFLLAAISQLELKNVRLEGLLPEGKKFTGLFFARAVMPPEKLYRFFQKKLQPGARVVLASGGEAPFPAVPNYFAVERKGEYGLPMNCGRRRLQLLQFVPRGKAH